MLAVLREKLFVQVWRNLHRFPYPSAYVSVVSQDLNHGFPLPWFLHWPIPLAEADRLGSRIASHDVPLAVAYFVSENQSRGRRNESKERKDERLKKKPADDANEA